MAAIWLSYSQALQLKHHGNEHADQHDVVDRIQVLLAKCWAQGSREQFDIDHPVLIRSLTPIFSTPKHIAFHVGRSVYRGVFWSGRWIEEEGLCGREFILRFGAMGPEARA